MKKTTQKRHLNQIFASFKAEAEKRKNIAECLAEINSVIDETEDYLGTKGHPIEGTLRRDLMYVFGKQRQIIQGYDEDCQQFSMVIEDLQAEVSAKDEHIELQQRLLDAYRQLSTIQNSDRQELIDKIEALTKQLSEMEAKKPAPKKDKAASSPEDAECKLKASIKRCQLRHERLERELEELQNSPAREEEVCGENTESSQSIVPFPAESNPFEAGTDETDADEVEVDEGEGSDNTESEDIAKDSDVLSAEASEKEKVLQIIENLEGVLNGMGGVDDAKVELSAEEQAELNYQIHKTTGDSNTPSGKMAPWATAKPATSGIDDDDFFSEDEMAKVLEEDAEEVIRQKAREELQKQEEKANTQALHDPNKSPNVKPKTGKRGKKKGSPGGGRKEPKYDELRKITCPPHKCQSCPHRDTCDALKNAKKVDRTHKVYDIEIRRIMTEYQTTSCECPIDGQVLVGSFPKGCNGTFQFGSGIRTLAITLNTIGMVSYDRIADILQGMLQDDMLSKTSINHWLESFADKIRPAIRYIKAGAFSSEYLNSDESGIKVKGVLHWVHTTCSMMFTYMRVDRRRGDDAMTRIGVLPGYMGTIITDCWASYWDKGSRHGLCNAHILRELFALVKFFVRDREWAQKMMDLLNEMNKARNELKAADVTEFSKEQLEDYHSRYRAIVEEGLVIHPDDEGTPNGKGKTKKYRGRNLLDRLKEREENVLLFLEDFNVPFTNNDAERSLRFFSIKRSVVGSFDTYEGADDFAMIWSYIATAKKRDLNLYEAIEAAINDKAIDFLFTEEEVAVLEAEAADLDKLNKEQFLKDREEDKAQYFNARAHAATKVDEAIAARKSAAAIEKEAKRSEDNGAPQSVIAKLRKAVEEANAKASRLLEQGQKAIDSLKKLTAKVRERAWLGKHFIDDIFDWNIDEEMSYLKGEVCPVVQN